MGARRQNVLTRLVVALVLVAGLALVTAAPAGMITAPTVVVASNSAGYAWTEYRISFTTGPGTIYTAGTDKFTVVFPAGTGLPYPSFYPSGELTVTNNTTGASDHPMSGAPVSGQAVTVEVPATLSNITGGTSVTIKFSQIGNPPIGGNKTLTVAGNPSVGGSEPAVTSAPYLIKARIGLSLTSGVRGSSVHVDGNGFTPYTPVDVSFGGLVSTNASTDGNGYFGAYITVPSFAPPGVNHITATDASGVTSNSVDFTVWPTFSIFPTSGLSGSYAQLTGGAWASNTPITASVGGVPATVLPAGVTTTADGDIPSVAMGSGANTMVVIPVTMSSGSRTITVTIGSNSLDATFSIGSRSFTVTPTTGPIGTSVTLRGSGFTPGGNIAPGGITLYGLAWNAVAIPVDAGGSFSATLTVVGTSIDGLPTNTPLSIQAVDVSGARVSNSFTITQRSIALSPTTSGAGSTVQVNGTGFRANGTVNLTYGATPAGSCSVDGLGNFAGSITVPASATQGLSYMVTAADSVNPAAISATATHNVPHPAIAVAPSSAGAGQSITITGAGFPPISPLTALTIGGVGVAPPAVSSDAQGSWTTSVLIPSLSTGQSQVVVTLGGVTASAPITIVAPSKGAVSGTALLQGQTDGKGVKVTVGQTQQVSQTGAFLISDLAPGTYTVSVSMPGYLLAQKTGVTVVSGQTTNLGTVTLVCGDFNGDGQININDLVYAGLNFGKAQTPWP